MPFSRLGSLAKAAFLFTPFLLGLSLLTPLPQASAANAEDTSTLFEGPLYSIVLPEGWHHLSSKTGGRALVGDNYQKGTSNLGIIWVPDPDPVSDNTLTSSAIKRFLHLLDAPSATVTQPMKGQWHGHSVSEGVVLTQGSIKQIPITISAGVLYTDRGRFLLVYLSKAQADPAEQEGIIRSFTPKA